MNFFRFSALFVACHALGLALAHSQISTTEPVGFHTLTINSGLRTIGLPLVRTAAGRGAIAVSSQTTITASSTALNFGQLLDPATAYYLEITEGSGETHVGDRFDIDVPATRFSANHTLTMATTSPNNTSSGNLPDLAGYQFVIRPHLTLGFIFGTKGNTLLQGSTAATGADRVSFWNPALNNNAGAYETYYLYRTASGDVEEWRKADSGAANYDDRIIPPGAGLIIQRQGSTQVSIVVAGAVRLTAHFIQNFKPGLNLISAGYPVDATLRERGYTTAKGWTAATTTTNADQVEVWNASAHSGAGAFEPYFLLDTGSIEQWRKADGRQVNFANARILASDEAIFVRKVSAQPNASTPSTLIGDASVRYDFSSPFLELAKTGADTPLTEAFTFSLGVFAEGFTPTVSNQADWSSHFSSIGSTFWTDEGGGIGEFYSSATLTGNAGPFLEGAQLYLWGFNSTSLSPTTQWVLLTNPTDTHWKVIATPGGLERRSLDASDSGTVAVVGTIGTADTFANPYLRTATANLPSTPVPAVPPWALFGMTLALFAYLGRKSPRHNLPAGSVVPPR